MNERINKYPALVEELLADEPSGPKATNGLDNALDKGLATWDTLGLNAEPSEIKINSIKD